MGQLRKNGNIWQIISETHGNFEKNAVNGVLFAEKMMNLNGVLVRNGKSGKNQTWRTAEKCVQRNGGY